MRPAAALVWAREQVDLGARSRPLPPPFSALPQTPPFGPAPPSTITTCFFLYAPHSSPYYLSLPSSPAPSPHLLAGATFMPAQPIIIHKEFPFALPLNHHNPFKTYS